MLEDSSLGSLDTCFCWPCLSHVALGGLAVLRLLRASPQSWEGQAQAMWLFIVLLCKSHSVNFTSFQSLELCHQVKPGLKERESRLRLWMGRVSGSVYFCFKTTTWLCDIHVDVFRGEAFPIERWAECQHSGNLNCVQET